MTREEAVYKFVLEQFCEHPSGKQPGEIAGPPFRDRLPSGRLGPEHGVFDYDGEFWPNCQWDEARADWAMRPYWDRHREWREDEDDPPKPKNKEKLGLVELDAWMCKNSATVPIKELEVWTLFYKDGLTTARTAHALGMSKNTARNHLFSLRKRAGL